MKTHLLDIPVSPNPIHEDHLGKTWCGRTLTGLSMVGGMTERPKEKPTCRTCLKLLKKVPVGK